MRITINFKKQKPSKLKNGSSCVGNNMMRIQLFDQTQDVIINLVKKVTVVLLKIPGKHFLCLVKKLNSHQPSTLLTVWNCASLVIEGSVYTKMAVIPMNYMFKSLKFESRRTCPGDKKETVLRFYLMAPSEITRFKQQ